MGTDQVTRPATLPLGSDDVEATVDAQGGAHQGAGLRPLPQPGDALGRYRLLECVGRGAMGAVFAAYDPELDRRIAIKLLGDAPRDDALLAEARALAKLSHPNVVAVYDVGRVDAGAFIAMEFVVGRTLRAWLERGEHTVSEVLSVFVEAGRGLAAAHAAGIVHRDFKPENVLIGDDGEGTGGHGRVRVGDFGLARPLRGPTSSTGGDGEVALSDGSATRQAGTPAYMAPELFLGEPADARSDVFAFCVALWEALYGERPFTGRTVAELVSSALEAVRIPKDAGDVPRRVTEAMRRGLDPDPRQRFADMPALLAALAPPRRRSPWAALAVTAMALGATGTWIGLRPRAAACDTDWAAWSPEVANTVVAALGQVPVDDVGAIAAAVRDDLDGFAAAHGQARGEICRLGEADPLEAAIADACVVAMRHNAEAVIEVFAAPDRDVAMASAALRATLGDPGRCLDPEVARREAPIETDPLALARAEPVRSALARVRTTLQAGRIAEAAALLDAVLGEVEALADGAVHAEAALLLGEIREEQGAEAAANAAFYDAVWWATRVGDRRQVASAWIELIYTEGYLRENPEGARLAMRQSEAEIEGLGGDERLAARRLARMTAALFADGKLLESRQSAIEAIEIYRRLGADLEVANVMMNLVNVDIVAVRAEDASAEIDEVEAIWTTRLPAGHPYFARLPESRARIASARGDLALELQLVEQAYELRRRAQGEGHPETLLLLSGLIGTLLDRGDIDRALEMSERAIAHVGGPERASLRMNLGRVRAAVLLAAGRAPEAASLMADAMRIAQTELRDGSPQLVDMLELHAHIAEATGDHQTALGDYQRVLELERSVWGPSHPYVVLTHLDLAQAHHALGSGESARAALATAATVFDAMTDTSARTRAELLVELARVAWLLGDPIAGRSFADRARAAAGELEASEAAGVLATLPPESSVK